jgi:hypothetical protein
LRVVGQSCTRHCQMGGHCHAEGVAGKLVQQNLRVDIVLRRQRLDRVVTMSLPGE